MAVSHLHEPHELTQIDIKALLPYQFNGKVELAPQIATHLQRTLEHCPNDHYPSVQLPSTMVLADFYQCSILDVLDGLFELKRHHYEYMLNGLDGEILLHDPMARKKNCKGMAAWRALAEEQLLHPWSIIKRNTHNPLV